ncbi:MAG: hypothetical protein ACLRZ9_02130 [Eubacterium sp.]
MNWLEKSKKFDKKQCFAVIISEDRTVDIEIANQEEWMDDKSSDINS